MMKILALDLGTKTGWAFSGGGRVESGTQDFSLKRGESPGMRYVRFRAWLEECYHLGGGFDLITYEEAHHRGGAATEILAGLTTRVQEFCAIHGINHASLHSATLKLFANASGRAGKAEMKQAASKLAGREIESDDEADALLLLSWARKEFDQEREKP